MNQTRVGLKLALARAGIDRVQMRTFSERFNVQKRIYLVQLFGLDLGYRYGWYLKGPYSRSLTEDAFTLKDELDAGDSEADSYSLSDEATTRIDRAKGLWAPPSGGAVDQDQWLELLSSLHYLKHIVYWPKDGARDFETVFNKLIYAKPRFADQKPIVKEAWKRLDQFGLIEAKTLA